MEPLHIKSEEALVSYLKKFLKAKPDAVQLDGSTQRVVNRGIMLVFTYSVNGNKYKIAGDFTRKAAEEFVRLTEEHGSPSVVLKEYQIDGKELGLILANSTSPNGFNFFVYTNKASDRLKKAA